MMSAITRRRFAAGALAASAAPVLGRAARAQTAVKIGTAVLGDYSMAGPVIVALERGFFAAEGLAVEFVPFRGGPDPLKAVMVGECLVGISGRTDIFVFPDAAAPIRKSGRALFRAIKLMRETPKEAAELVAKKLGWTPEAVLAAHKISGPLLPVDGHIDVEALAVMQNTLLEHGLLKKKLPLDEHYTREFTPVRV